METGYTVHTPQLLTITTAAASVEELDEILSVSVVPLILAFKTSLANETHDPEGTLTVVEEVPVTINTLPLTYELQLQQLFLKILGQLLEQLLEQLLQLFLKILGQLLEQLLEQLEVENGLHCE